MTGPELIVYVGAVATLVGLWWLLAQHRIGKLDLTDVVMEPDAHGVRRASIRKIGEAVALGASTFVVVFDTASDGTANEWVFGLYCGAWVSRTLFGMLAQARAGAITAGAGGAK